MLDNFCIILARPQLSNNIGSVARSMLNFSCHNLRLISPKEDWNNDSAQAIAAGATTILDKAQIFSSVTEAATDLDLLFALTTRNRFINKPFINLKEINSFIDSKEKSGKIGLLFGPENSGLSNEDLVLTHKLFFIPTNHEFSSLNLSHAVTTTLYQLFNNILPISSSSQSSLVAKRIELDHFFNHLQKELEQTNFFQVDNKKASMLRNIKNIFSRIDCLTSQEIRTLRGIITSLSNKTD